LRFGTSTATLRGQETVIGRSPYSTVVMTDPSVSRVHASISKEDGGVMVRDLGSKNGTKVNRKLVGPDPVPLGAGDVLVLGQVTCMVEAASAQARRITTTDRPISCDEDPETTRRVRLRALPDPDDTAT